VHTGRSLPAIWARSRRVKDCRTSSFKCLTTRSKTTDNIAPPVASCLGDLVTLSFLGIVSALLIYVINTPVPLVLGIFVVLSACTCATFTLRNPKVKNLVKEGWSPLFGAMVISSCTGIVLDMFVHRYEDFALLAVAISG
jgi:solute carrier family 41